MSTPTLILGNNKWAIEEDSILGYAVEDRNGSYLPREIPFTRGSDATYTDSTGVIRQACWNLLGYSEEFDNAIWTKAATNITANSTTSPNGSTNADTITADGTTSLHRLGVGLSITTGTNYTLSIYAKKNTNNFIQIVGGFDAFGSNVWANFDLNIGVVGSVGSSTTASIVNIGDGWYRCILTGLSTATTTVLPYQIVLISSATSLRAETNNLSTSVFIWGAQLVQGSDALGYLRTTDRLNMPRVDSSTGTKAFLVEPQRTNLLLWSDDLTTWGKTNVTALTNVTTSPDGSVNADLVTATASTGSHLLTNGNHSATTVTASVYVKKSTHDFIQIYSGWAAVAYANFDINNGVVGAYGTGTIASIQNVGNGWYRCIFTTISTANSTIRWCLVSSSTAVFNESWTANGTESVFIWGAQVEQGAYPSTYIPTQATTVTRIVDSFNKSNIYTNGYIGQTSGTWFVEFKNNLSLIGDGGGDWISLTDSGGTSGNGFRFYNPPSLSRMIIYKIISSAGTPLFTTTTDSVKVAIKWNGSTADVFVNGVKEVSATVFTFTAMQILSTGITAVPKYIQQMKLYSAALDDAECISITTL